MDLLYLVAGEFVSQHNIQIIWVANWRYHEILVTQIYYYLDPDFRENIKRSIIWKILILFSSRG